MSPIKKLVSGLVALLVAFLTVFVFAHPEQQTIVSLVVTVVSALFGMWGVFSFRTQLDAAMNTLKSKTMQGGISTGVVIIILSVLGYFNVTLPPWLIEALKYLIGGTSLYTVLGSSHALVKAENNNVVKIK